MKKLLPFIILILAFSASAQKKKKAKVVKKDTIADTILAKMAEPTVCGQPEWAEKEIYTGTIVKRVFDEDELQLSGFVLRDANDERVYINIDTEYVSGLASSATQAVSSSLLKNTKVKVWVYRCRRILYAYKIQIL